MHRNPVGWEHMVFSCSHVTHRQLCLINNWVEAETEYAGRRKYTGRALEDRARRKIQADGG